MIFQSVCGDSQMGYAFINAEGLRLVLENIALSSTSAPMAADTPTTEAWGTCSRRVRKEERIGEGYFTILYFVLDKKCGMIRKHKISPPQQSIAGVVSDLYFRHHSRQWGEQRLSQSIPSRYEGVYGSKSGWSVPIAQGVGIEGGGGSMVR